jgi:small-conductance mechanosensitive channel
VNALGILVLALVAICVLIHIFRERRVTANLICASIVVYLIIGLVWGFAYGLLDSLQPESFSIPEGKLENSRLLFLYYSFVSLTTLGYGDVTPMTAPASFLSLIEAIVGQMYVAILVARLVGINISQSLQNDSGGSERGS